MTSNMTNPNPEFEADTARDELSLEEIEAAYMRALETAESAEHLIPELDQEEIPELEEEFSDTLAVENSSLEDVESIDDLPVAEADDSKEEEVRVTQLQVAEGLLFVGGEPLPAKKMTDLLGGTTTHEQVDLLIEELNQRYASENRPYEIRLVEGGYTMVLKAEHEHVRRRVYGQGPKDVKLSQEALEVLAFVAYQQPTTREDVEAIGKKNAGGLLRQLLRRQLIVLNRNEQSDSETYQTTKRFLDLFGLGSIDDLPQATDFDFK